MKIYVLLKKNRRIAILTFAIIILIYVSVYTKYRFDGSLTHFVSWTGDQVMHCIRYSEADIRLIIPNLALAEGNQSIPENEYKELYESLVISERRRKVWITVLFSPLIMVEDSVWEISDLFVTSRINMVTPERSDN